MKFKGKLKDQRGITLIALIITIIVLVILAAVSISAVYNSKIVSHAVNGATGYSNEALNENKIMKYTEDLIESTVDQIYEIFGKSGEEESPKEEKARAGTVLATKPSTWASDEVKPIADGNGDTVPLPNGFYYVGGDIGSGIVISDKEGDKIDATGTSMGNQFVWIPAKEADLTRTNFDTEGNPTNSLDAKYTEPLNYGESTGYTGEESEYNTMREQVIKYNGFYIGRFEAGINSTSFRTGVTNAQTVVCKKGVAPYNYVPWGKSMNDASERSGQSGAVYLAKNFWVQEGYTSVESTLCYGCQWDAMCRYIEDSGRTTPTKSGAGLTGSVETDISKNIYDLAGNCLEWTMETNRDNLRVLRGGCYDYAYPVSPRKYGALPGDTNGYNAFRLTLYIK